MCGRYVNVASSTDIASTFGITSPADELPELAPNWSIRPTDQVFGVLDRHPDDEDRTRELHLFTWGLIPSWTKTQKDGIRSAPRMINARVEGLTERPAYRTAIAKRRAIVPMAGYYEWTEQPDPAGGRKPLKMPHYLHPAAGEEQLLAAAALYAWWRDPDKTDDDPDRWLASITIVTRDAATQDLAAIHTRMPLFLQLDRIGEWLDPQLVDGEHARQLLLEQHQPAFEIRNVSRDVNRPGASGPQLIEPVPGEVDQPLALASAGL